MNPMQEMQKETAIKKIPMTRDAIIEAVAKIAHNPETRDADRLRALAMLSELIDAEESQKRTEDRLEAVLAAITEAPEA